MVLWVRIARLATLTRAHNARGNSQTHVHEQSIGILNQYTSNRAPRDNIAGFSGFQALSSLDLATVDWGKHSEAKKEEMLASAYEKAGAMNDMLQNKRYDGHLLTSAVWRDPERAGEQYTPIYCDYFKTLFDHATSSSTSGAALLKNPLAGLVEELDSFLQDHSHEVPKIGLQIRDSLCGHDAARCGYPARA